MCDPEILIQRYVEGVLGEAEAEALRALLEARPEMGERLLGHLEMDAMLRATRELAEPGVARAPGLLPRRRFTVTTVAMAAAAAACVTLAAAWAAMWLTGREGREKEPTTASVAVLTRVVSVEWESPAMAPGTPLSPGVLKWGAGMAQIEFYQGARVWIEGPAEIELVSAGEATCRRGKLSAEVPPQARGFRVNTPTGTVVDLGTAFGLEVGAAGSEVHVFEGVVEVHPGAAETRALKEGEALSFAGTPRMLAASREGFASLDEIDARTADSQRGELERWRERARRLDEDPGLRLRFDFQDGEGTRSLMNRARYGREIADGSIVGAGWTRGRWPGKGALEFRNVSDRVRLSVPGETASLTLAVWVRVNGLDRAFNSLFMSEGWGERKIHWQITHDGRVRLGVAGAKGQRHADYDTPVLFTPERFGRWTHLAAQFDPETGEVRHYAGGELVARLRLVEAAPLRIGMAELGNWNDQGSKGGVAIRHLSGAMDEFALWERVLTSVEIEELAK